MHLRLLSSFAFLTLTSATYASEGPTLTIKQVKETYHSHVEPIINVGLNHASNNPVLFSTAFIASSLYMHHKSLVNGGITRNPLLVTLKSVGTPLAAYFAGSYAYHTLTMAKSSQS